MAGHEVQVNPAKVPPMFGQLGHEPEPAAAVPRRRCRRTRGSDILHMPAAFMVR